MIKQAINERYQQSKSTAADILITPESSRLLRGLLRLTLNAAATRASVKKNQLNRFEQGDRPLSARDRRWLQSVFESAGAEFFTGQGQLHVHLDGQPVIVFGECVDDLKNLPVGGEATEQRHLRSPIFEKPGRGFSRYHNPSQRDVAQLMGVSQAKISAIENNKSKQFHLADLVALKKVYDSLPINEDNAEHIASGKKYGSKFIGGWFRSPN